MNSSARSIETRTVVSVVKVLPRPMSSARIPPKKSSCDLLLVPVITCWKLVRVRSITRLQTVDGILDVEIVTHHGSPLSNDLTCHRQRA